MTLTASEVASLKSALGCWEWVEYISTGVVFLGCIGELVEEFTPCVKSKENKHKLALLSLILVIAGIAGELLGTVRTSQISGTIIANIELQAGDAKTSADKAAADASNAKGSAVAANREAGNAELAAGKARLIASKAESQAEESESKLAQLERETAPRRISSDQRKKFLSSIQIPPNFNPKVDISADSLTSDAEDFAKDLRDLLHDGGFSPTLENLGRSLITGAAKSPSGIEFWVGRNRLEDFKALKTALDDAGITEPPIPMSIDSKEVDILLLWVVGRTRPALNKSAKQTIETLPKIP